MPKGRSGLENARRSLEHTIRKAVGDIIKPYQKEIAEIQKDAVKLQSSLEKLASKIGQDAAGSIRARRAHVRKLSGATKNRIAKAMKAAWARRKGQSAA